MSVARHTSYNIAGAVVPIALSLVLTPIFVFEIGLARYGLLSICWALLGYFGLFDFGTGRAIAQKIAALRHGTEVRRNKAFWTSLAICVPLCIIAAAAVLGVKPLIIAFLDVDDATWARELRDAFPWLALAVPLTMLTAQFSGALEGSERFGFVNAVSIFTNVLVISLPLLAAFWVSPRLDILVAAATLARLPGFIVMIVGAYRLIPLASPQIERSDTSTLLAFGGWSTISNTIGPVLLVFDRFLIGRIIGPAAVGVYVLPFSLITQLQILPSATMRALFPKIAYSDERTAAEASASAITLLNFIMTCVLAVAALACSPFLVLWLGRDVGLAAAPVAYALILGVWANSLALVPAVALQAQAKVRFLGLLHMAEIAPYLALLYAGTRYLGITGAALAWSVRCVVDALIIFRRKRPPVDLAPLVRNGAGLLLISALSLALPLESLLRWIALAAIGLTTIWNAWRQRPDAARKYEALMLSRLHVLGRTE